MKIRTCLAARIVAFLPATMAFLGATPSRADPTQVHATPLRSAEDIVDAAAAHSATRALLDAAKSCPPSDLQLRIQCVCTLKPELAAVERAQATVAAKHPAWIKPNAAVSYVDPNNGEWVVIVFGISDSAAEMCRAH